MRTLLDRLLKMGIKLCLLTGVAFTFAACYAPAPMPEDYDEPANQEARQKMELQLQTAAQEEAQVD